MISDKAAARYITGKQREMDMYKVHANMEALRAKGIVPYPHLQRVSVLALWSFTMLFAARCTAMAAACTAVVYGTQLLYGRGSLIGWQALAVAVILGAGAIAVIHTAFPSLDLLVWRIILGGAVHAGGRV